MTDFFRVSPDLSPRQSITLSTRERQVLEAISDGHTYGEIAKQLFLTTGTIKTHSRRLLRKLGARDQAHAVANAFRAGVLK